MSEMAVDPKNMWIVRGKRYDLTDFIDQHPGGQMSLQYAKGRDCTEMFYSYHSLSDKPFALMKKFETEDQTDVPEPVFNWEKTPFYDRLKTRVRAHFGEVAIAERHYKCDLMAWARYLTFCLLTIVSFRAWHQGEWWSLIGLPVFYWLGPSGLMHSGSHWALHRNHTINALGAYTGSAHVSILHWYHQHVIGHHSHTNIDGMDPDLNHFQHMDEAGPGYRLHSKQPWLKKYKFWRISLWLQAWFTTMGPAIMNQLEYCLSGYFHCVPVLNVSAMRMLWHLIGRVAILCVLSIYPWFIFEPWKAAFFATLPYGIHGVIYFGFSQVSHLNDECMLGDVPLNEKEWAVHQIENCSDYCTGSLFWRTASIGLNAQAIHHLFPHVEPCHYGPLSLIVAQTCKEFGIKYSTSPSLFAALSKHYNYVASVNEPDHPKHH